MKGMKWSVPIACALRHELAIRLGEENDPESGLPHRGHIACNLIMLMYYVENYPEGDDRRGEPKEPTFVDDPLARITDPAPSLYDDVTEICPGHVIEIAPPATEIAIKTIKIGDKVRVKLGFHRHHGKVGTVIGTVGGKDFVSGLYVPYAYNVEFDGGAQERFGEKEIEDARTG